MPKIKSYTPGWLSKGSPGNNLFAPSTDVSRASLSSPYSGKSNKRLASGPRRTIARRGTEFFVANGREIRWGDLVYLKEMHTSKGASRVKREDSDDDDTVESIENRAAGFRVGHFRLLHKLSLSWRCLCSIRIRLTIRRASS